MTTTTVDESYYAEAEVYNGHDLCKQKSIELLEELCLPKGLLPLEDIEEFGYNRLTGFIWLIQKNQINHSFPQISRSVTYAREITAFVEKYKIKKITGVKIKELLVSFSIAEVYFENPASEMLTIKAAAGLSGSYIASAFELKD